MSMGPSWQRQVMSRLPLTAAVVGMSLVFGAIILFYFENAQARITATAIGMLVLLVGMWYTAHPFVSNERKYLPLRVECDRFIGLVRKLNGAALTGDSEGLERTRQEMYSSVERMVDLAGKTQDAPAREPAGQLS